MSDGTLDKQSTTKGFAILSIAGLIVKGLSLFYIPFLRRILGDEGIGIYSYAYNIYVFLYVITNSGIPVAISKNISELIALGHYKDAVRSFKISRLLLFIVGLIMSIFMFIFSGSLCEFIGSPESKLAVMALAPTLLITSILSTYRGYFQGRENMTPTAISQVIEQVCNIVFSLGFAYYFNLRFSISEGVAGATTGTAIGAFAAVLILLYFYEKNKTIALVKEVKFTKKRFTSKRLLMKILNYSVPMTFCVAMQNAGLIIDGKIAKYKLLNIGLNEKNANIMWGWVHQYNTLIGVPITIIMSLSIAVLPAISSFAVLKDKKALSDKINYAFRLCFLISVPCALGFLVLSGPICRLLGYSRGAAVLLTLGSINLILMSLVQIQTSILQGMGKIYLVTVYSVLGLLGKVIVNYIFIGISVFNIKGILLGNFVCFLIPFILNNRVIKKSLRIKLRLFRRSRKTFFSAANMAVCAYVVNEITYSVFKIVLGTGYISNAIPTCISIILASYVYLYILILTGGVTKEDFKVFPSKILKFIPNFIVKHIV